MAEGQGSNGGTRFENTVVILAPGASVTRKGSTIILDSAREVMVLSSISTDYNIRKPEAPLTHSLAAKNARILAKAQKAGWKKLAAETEDYFSRLMTRCQVDLGGSPAGVSAMTTAQRLERVKQGRIRIFWNSFSSSAASARLPTPGRGSFPAVCRDYGIRS